MNRPLVIGAALAVLLTSGAQARPHHHRHHIRHHQSVNQTITCNMQGCHDGGVTETRSSHGRGHQVGSANCLRNLGCGCNLANHFGGISRFGYKLWRSLWVAKNWAHEGSHASKGCTDCVAVLTRRGGGHVGIVKGYDANGNPIIYSYANGRLGWTTTTYSSKRVIAYRSL